MTSKANPSKDELRSDHDTQTDFQMGDIDLSDTEDQELFKNLLQESQLQEDSTRSKRRSKRSTPILEETTEGKSLKEIILKLRKYFKSFDTQAAVFKAPTTFQDKNIRVDAISQSLSSSTDKLEEYPALGFPYKRAVKLKVETDTKKK
ncbi:DUF228 domain-containing protein [Borrelia puertoricensis]|uniref:DUF228 domain-containing protein n=1 Tax=Borrelia puertoricensis TaxID=2756107 RepID=UPI001FF67704|nr:DUF228 domain-containing protein [Borrelia puertoricensis]UPA18522.1 DUF228 domain-containing protein [Borrelia puertoricensis]